MGVKFNMNVTGHVCLCVLEESLHVSHYGIKMLPFVQPVAVELGQLFFPRKLPFREDMFFQGMMCLNDQHGGGRFESHAAFYSNNGVPNVNISSNTKRCGNLL